MPTLPTLDSLGARPTPASRRGVSYVNNAGAVGDAASGLGDQVAGIGKQMIEKEDKLSYASARATMLKADVAARLELENEPDHNKYQGMYAERMKSARAQASSMIASRSDRSMFEAEAELDFVRGDAEVMKTVRGKVVAAKKGMFAQAVIDANEAGQGALDDATREQTILTLNDLYDGGVKAGILSPEDAVAGRRSAVQGYVIQQYDSRMARGDFEAAASILDANRGRLDGAVESRMDANLIERKDHRDVLTASDAYFAGGGAVKPNGAPGAPVGNDQIFAALIKQESGGRAQYGVQTQWGRAEGSTQMLPDTAKGMAKKLGVAWHPELLGDNNSKEALAYQSMLGRAYFDEGLQKYKGDVRSALKYYHGGTDQKQWGPKTNAYADQVLARVGITDQQSPGHHDLNDALDWADRYAAEKDWTPEKRDQLKTQIQSRVALDDRLKAREEDDTEQALWERADALGESLKDPSQLGPDFYKLPAAKRGRFRAIIEHNLVPKEAPANGDTVTSLELMRINDPARFATVNLGEYAPSMTRAELNQLRVDQAKVKTGGPETVEIASKVAGTIGRYDTPDLWATDKGEAARQRVRVQRLMESDIGAVTGGKRPPTDDELYKAFISATGDTVTLKKTFMGFETGGTVTRRRFETRPGDVPEGLANRITAALKSRGINPTDERVAEEYQMGKGRFW